MVEQPLKNIIYYLFTIGQLFVYLPQGFKVLAFMTQYWSYLHSSEKSLCSHDRRGCENPCYFVPLRETIFL